MGTGLENAFGEITLVLFTTLAPSGVVAMILLSFGLFSPHADDELRGQLNRLIGIPVAIALAGLVASATHLGNPANALYVLTGVGRSPLSNEVFAGVVYFGLAGTYWFGSFSERVPAVLSRVWLAVSDLAGVVFVLAIAYAYNADTIVTWNAWYVPVNLCLNSLVGGPLLAVMVLAAAERTLGRTLRYHAAMRTFVCVAAAALALNLVGYVLQGVDLAALGNSLASAFDRVPGYYAAMALFGVLSAAGIYCDVWLVLRGDGGRRVTYAAVGVLLALMGIFVMRFVFYMSYLTVGLGV